MDGDNNNTGGDQNMGAGQNDQGSGGQGMGGSEPAQPQENEEGMTEGGQSGGQQN